MFGLPIGTNPVAANDPLPIDPTLNPIGGTGGAPPPATAADPDYWWNSLIPLLAAMFPDATYDELCDFAFVMFNLLPPEHLPTSTVLEDPLTSGAIPASPIVVPALP